MRFSDNILKIRINKEDMFRIEEIALIFFFSGNSITYLVGRLMGLIGLSAVSSLGVLVIHTITVIGIVIGLLRLNRSRLFKCLAFLFFIFMLILFSYILNPEIGIWLSDSTYGIGSIFGLDGHIFSGGVIAFYVLITQKDPDRIIRALKISVLILSVYLFLMFYHRMVNGYFIVEGASGLRQTEYNMSFGYYCAFASTLLYIFWIDSKRKIYIFTSIIFAALAVSFGSRGVIITYALFIVSLLWTSLRSVKISRRLFFILLIGIFAFFIVNFYSEIVLGIQYLFKSMGISNSRTISILASSDIFDSNGRDDLWSLGTSLIKDKFPLGYGFFGERTIIGNIVRWGYVHNVILELVIEFGIIGVVILIFMLYKTCLFINNDSNKKWNLLFIVFFSNCGILLVSNSFWYCPYFWGTIAVGVLYNKLIKSQVFDRKVGGFIDV